jgi:hypothetical protein
MNKDSPMSFVQHDRRLHFDMADSTRKPATNIDSCPIIVCLEKFNFTILDEVASFIGYSGSCNQGNIS